MAVGYQDRYKDAGLMALMGSGFDPGVTNVFCAYAQKHRFDEIHYVDIVDCNAGDHGKAFATNFNPEIVFAKLPRMVATGKTVSGLKRTFRNLSKL